MAFTTIAATTAFLLVVIVPFLLVSAAPGDGVRDDLHDRLPQVRSDGVVIELPIPRRPVSASRRFPAALPRTARQDSCDTSCQLRDSRSGNQCATGCAAVACDAQGNGGFTKCELSPTVSPTASPALCDPTCVATSAWRPRECPEGCVSVECTRRVSKCSPAPTPSTSPSPTPLTCENKCRTSERRTTTKCQKSKYAALGCSVNSCYKSSGSGFACSDGPISDMPTTKGWCIDLYKFSSFYQFGYKWPVDSILPCRTSDNGVNTYIAFGCTSCGAPFPCTSNPCSGNPATLEICSSLKENGVTLDQVKADCVKAGTSNGYPVYDCSQSYLQGAAASALATC